MSEAVRAVDSLAWAACALRVATCRIRAAASADGPAPPYARKIRTRPDPHLPKSGTRPRSYASRTYDSSRCMPLPHEPPLYRLRQGRRSSRWRRSARRPKSGHSVTAPEEAVDGVVHMQMTTTSRHSTCEACPYNATAGVRVASVPSPQHNNVCGSQLSPASSYSSRRSTLWGCRSPHSPQRSRLPPGGLYNRPLSPSNVLVTERHAWDAPLKAPKWIGMSGTHLPQVQPTDATPHHKSLRIPRCTRDRCRQPGRIACRGRPLPH